jgi:hypothetical protein
VLFALWLPENENICYSVFYFGFIQTDITACSCVVVSPGPLTDCSYPRLMFLTFHLPVLPFRSFYVFLFFAVHSFILAMAFKGKLNINVKLSL